MYIHVPTGPLISTSRARNLFDLQKIKHEENATNVT